jgi:hypothetical protein
MLASEKVRQLAANTRTPYVAGLAEIQSPLFALLVTLQKVAPKESAPPCYFLISLALLTRRRRIKKE